jgi:[ribosomal protein S5]-alanine N-acetyltransferase
VKNAFLVGERVYLRALEREDLTGDYFSWLNDFEVTKNLASGTFPNNMQAMEAYYNAKQGSTSDVMLGIVLFEGDRLIGTVKLGFINWIHRTAELGIMIGDKSYWGKGYFPEVTKLMFGYAFRRLNLNKVNAGVASNAPHVELCDRLGFQTEGLVRSAAFIDGQYVDKILIGITREEYFALEGA